MKIDILLVHFVVIAAVIIPFVLFIMIEKKEKYKLRREFYRRAWQRNLRFDLVDAWNQNYIGLDKSHGFVLFVQRKREAYEVEIVDVSKIGKSSFHYYSQKVKINKKTEDVLQNTCIELSLINGEKQVLKLYSSETNFYQDFEIAHAEKWNQILNEAIPVKPLVNSAA